MELWDIYDSCMQKTGRLHERGMELKEGDYHLVVHIYPINKNGEILIQKRSISCQWSPGCWAATGGSAIAGEDFFTACQRELHEELGICAEKEKTQLAAVYKRDDSFVGVFVLRCDVPVKELKLQKEEVEEAGWITLDMLKEINKKGLMHKYVYFDWLTEYIEKLILLEKISM